VRTALDLAEGFHLAHAFAALVQAGILDSLRKPVDARKLAARHRVDLDVLEAALQMLAARTDLIARRAGKYRVTVKTLIDWKNRAVAALQKWIQEQNL